MHTQQEIISAFNQWCEDNQDWISNLNSVIVLSPKMKVPWMLNEEVQMAVYDTQAKKWVEIEYTKIISLEESEDDIIS